MKRLGMLLSVGAITLVGLLTTPGLAEAYVPPTFRGHSYHFTQADCQNRGRNGQSRGEFAYYACHQDGWDHPSLAWHLVVSIECPICRGDEAGVNRINLWNPARQAQHG